MHIILDECNFYKGGTAVFRRKGVVICLEATFSDYHGLKDYKQHDGRNQDQRTRGSWGKAHQRWRQY